MNTKIGARAYDIAIVDDVDFFCELEKRGCNDTDVKSFIDYDDQLIFVRQSLKSDHVRELILHELLHACVEDSGVNAHENNAHEVFVSAVAPRLNHLLTKKFISVLDKLI